MDKLCMRDFVGPGTGVGSVEDPKLCFNLLVDVFCFAIRLWMVCDGKGEVIVEEFAKFFGKGRGELQATI